MAVPAVDPSERVIALVAVHAEHAEKVRLLERQLTDAQVKHTNEVNQLRAEHTRELAAAESKRIDAVREVDVLNQSVAADRTLTAVQTLAATVEATAKTLTASNAATTETINGRLAALEKSMYEGAGKGTGYSAMWGWIAGGVLLLLAVLKFWNP